jgi:hypothetical protein
MKKIAILQSNYLPWKGYFDIIASVDEFVLYDDVQFTKNDWRNRNKIKVQNGTQWLSVPVGHDIHRLIRDVEIKDERWPAKHWASIFHAYHRAPYFEEVALGLRPLYLERKYSNLSMLNRSLIEFVCVRLGINTKISNSWDYQSGDGKTDRLVNLCKQAGADEYVSGPSARDYLDETQFAKAGIKVTYFDYGSYPEYPQLWSNFEHAVSVIDLLFNVGPNAANYMKYVR